MTERTRIIEFMGGEEELRTQVDKSHIDRVTDRLHIISCNLLTHILDNPVILLNEELYNSTDEIVNKIAIMIQKLKESKDNNER